MLPSGTKSDEMDMKACVISADSERSVRIWETHTWDIKLEISGTLSLVIDIIMHFWPNLAFGCSKHDLLYLKQTHSFIYSSAALQRMEVRTDIKAAVRHGQSLDFGGRPGRIYITITLKGNGATQHYQQLTHPG